MTNFNISQYILYEFIYLRTTHFGDALLAILMRKYDTAFSSKKR